MSVVFDKKVLDCFSTLGIEPTNNMCMIHSAYRDTVRMVHPDKVRHFGLKWTNEVCRTAFENIRESYIYLKGQFNEIDLPDYDIVYLDEEFDATSVVSFDLEEFNRQFTASQSVYADDYASLGYSDFACKSHLGLSVEDALDSLKRSRESISLRQETEAPIRTRGQLMKYLPDALLAAPTMQHSIIGETVDDFTVGTTLTDIRVAYENDYETWEETYGATHRRDRACTSYKASPDFATERSSGANEFAGVDATLCVALVAAIESRLKIEPLGKHELEQLEERKRLEDDIERNRRRRAALRGLAA